MLPVVISFVVVVAYVFAAAALKRAYRGRRVALSCEAEALLADATISKSDKVMVEVMMHHLFSYEIALFAARKMGSAAWRIVFSRKRKSPRVATGRDDALNGFCYRAVMCILATNSLAAFVFARGCLAAVRLIYRAKHHSKMPMTVVIDALDQARGSGIIAR